MNREERDFAAPRSVVFAGRLLSVGVFSNLHGETRSMLHAAPSGSLIGSEPVHDDWIYVNPDEHLSTRSPVGVAYAVTLCRRSAYLVDRLASRPGWRGVVVPEAVHVSAVTTGWVDSRPVVLARGQ